MIRWEHLRSNHATPTTHAGVLDTMAGIRRELGVAPSKKTAATVERVAAMLAHVDRESLKGLRDAALLLFGFASAMRRSELAALELEDLELTDRGLLVTVRRSKTDQEGHGQVRAIPHGTREELCPVRAIAEWLEAGDLSSGRVFRSVTRHSQVGESLRPATVAEVVKLYAKRAGLDPKLFGGHSLRAGFVTPSNSTSIASRSSLQSAHRYVSHIVRHRDSASELRLR